MRLTSASALMPPGTGRRPVVVSRRAASGEEVSVVVRFQHGPGPHSVLDIPPVSIGEVLHPLTSDDDLLGEMLESRRL